MTARVLYVFGTVREAEARFPRSMRRADDVVASAGSLSRWPHQLLGQRFAAAHLFHPVDENGLRLIRRGLTLTGGKLHRPGLPAVLPQLEEIA